MVSPVPSIGEIEKANAMGLGRDFSLTVGRVIVAAANVYEYGLMSPTFWIDPLGLNGVSSGTTALFKQGERLKTNPFAPSIAGTILCKLGATSCVTDDPQDHLVSNTCDDLFRACLLGQPPSRAVCLNPNHPYHGLPQPFK